MSTWLTTGGGLGPGGSGPSMKDLAPDGYDYYILSDGSGDYTDVTTAFVAIMGMGAGYYKVYVGEGDFTLVWTTSWASGVVVTLHGAGKDRTRIVMDGSTSEFGSLSNGKGFAEIAYINFEATDLNATGGYIGMIEVLNGTGFYVLPDGTIAPGSFHDCKVTVNNTSGQHEWGFMYVTDGISVYNCEFTGNHGVGPTYAGEGVIWIEAGSQIRNCEFAFPDGTAIIAHGGVISSCKFYGAGTAATDHCISTEDSSAGWRGIQITGCEFHQANGSHVIKADWVVVGVNNCHFYYIDQAAAFTATNGGTVVESQNVFKDTVS